MNFVRMSNSELLLLLLLHYYPKVILDGYLAVACDYPSNAMIDAVTTYSKL